MLGVVNPQGMQTPAGTLHPGPLAAMSGGFGRQPGTSGICPQVRATDGYASAWALAKRLGIR